MTIREKSDEDFMRLALKEASYALEADEIPVGAVVVYNGKVVGKGHNQVELLKDVSAHAEMIALTAASQKMNSKYLQDCTLYVTLEPCSMCAGALFWYQIGRVVFGASDERRGFSRLIPTPLHPKTTVISGVLEAECSKMLKLFFQSLR
jgi:tRNA(adenine34) deaminase